MTASARRSRPLRRLFGLAAALLAAVVAAVASAVENNGAGVPTVPEASRLPMLGYAAVLLLVGAYAVATSFGRKRPATKAAATPEAVRRREERRVIAAFRRTGWYVTDRVVLPHVDVDHVAIGPAGILAIQSRWTDRDDPRGKPPIRARIAAQQLRELLARNEIHVDVVPAVLTFGPGLTEAPGGVRVVDAVAVLNGYQHDAWLAELGSRVLLPNVLVERAVLTIGDLIEGLHAAADDEVRRPQPALAT